MNTFAAIKHSRQEENMRFFWILIGLLLGMFPATTPCHADDASLDPATLIQASFDHYRGKASKADVEMVIHRPTWERSMRMIGWTKENGQKLDPYHGPGQGRGKWHAEKRDRHVDLQSQSQRVHQASAGDDVPKLDGIGFFKQRSGQKRQHSQRLHPQPDGHRKPSMAIRSI